MSGLILPRRLRGGLSPPKQQRGFIINPYSFGSSTPTDPYFANVSLLLHGNGTNGSTTITDSSSYGHTVTPHGSAQISTAQSQFGGSSIALLNSGDFLDIASHAAFGMGNGSFTIEGFNYRTASGGNRCLIDTRTAINEGCAIYASLTGDANALAYIDNSGSIVLHSGGGFTLNAFDHWEIDREMVAGVGTVWGYINGVMIFTGTDSRTFASASSCYIGDNYIAPSQPSQCYGDEIRITKGVSRHPGGGTFTPPTAPFPDS